MGRVTRATLTRRALLRRGGGAALGLGLLPQLAACGGGGDDRLVFSSWPEYIDFDDRTKTYPTLERFERQQGIAVEFRPEITDYVEYFGKLRPLLATGESGGRDIIVAVDWLAARLRRLGWLERLDALELPNVRRNLVDRLRDPDFDPDRHWSVPWQVGHTGLVYRRDQVGGELESLEDALSPRFRGRLVMQTEMRDTVGLVLFTMGEDPERASLDAALAAVERVEQLVQDGQVRSFAGFDYRTALSSGDAWIAMGWSGDAAQTALDDPRIAFSRPAEGHIVWTDNLCIPVGAKHSDAARRLMDFYYQPKVHAALTRALFYVPPVRGVDKYVPELAANPLIFPDEQTTARGRVFRTLTPDEETQLDEAFQRVIGA